MRFDASDAGVLDLGGTTLPAGRRLPFGLTPTMDGSQGARLVALPALPAFVGGYSAAAWVIESSSWTAAPRVTCEKEKRDHGHRSG
jgi:hypothetical protein